jgi:succinate dehydrogenase/fumarate reductase flavoprotein subunit
MLRDKLRLVRRPMPEYTAFNGMMVNKADAAALLGALSSFANFRRSCALLSRYIIDRIRYGRGTRLLLGNALVAALLKSVLDKGVVVRVEATPTKLITDNAERVIGVEYDWKGQHESVFATDGVVLATGGFPGDIQRKSTRVPFANDHHSVPPPTNDGGGLRLAEAIGAKVPEGNVSAFYYAPVSLTTRADGSKVVFPHLVLDRQKPGLIAVNRNGKRFANEANSYHDFVTDIQRANERGEASIPAYLICDQRFLRKYGLGVVHPGGLGVQRQLRSGYLTRAESIADLATKIGVDAAGLADTVERNNRSALAGEDKEFGRGSNAYHTFFGDPNQKPNPCLGSIKVAPYYAVRIWPGDIGSAEGLAVNESSQVIDESGKPIGGLYAAGNDMNSVFLGTYPGPGITLGPALTFGYAAGKAMKAAHDARAARPAGRVNQRKRAITT